MEKGIITQAIQQICFQNGKDLAEVSQYLKMKYKIDTDLQVLQKRLSKLLSEEKAVA